MMCFALNITNDLSNNGLHITQVQQNKPFRAIWQAKAEARSVFFEPSP